MNNTILKGSIMITDSTDVVYQFPLDGLHKIINLDEDDVLPENNNVIGGTCLLPPVAAKIAEADGNEPEYDNIYIDHLLAPFQQQFIAALLAFLYKGGNLLLFLPELGYTNTRDKLIALLYRAYGIAIGIVSPNPTACTTCFYDTTCIPIWLNLIYSTRIISAYEYLSMFPIDANLNTNPKIMEMLISDIRPYSDTIGGKINYILHYHKHIHEKPGLSTGIKRLE